MVSNKEKILIDLRMKQLESFDRDTTKTFFTILTGGFALLGFIYYNPGIIGNNNLVFRSLGITFLVGIGLLEFFVGRCVSKNYDKLFFAINKNKIREFKLCMNYFKK